MIVGMLHKVAKEAGRLLDVIDELREENALLRRERDEAFERLEACEKTDTDTGVRTLRQQLNKERALRKAGKLQAKTLQYKLDKAHEELYRLQRSRKKLLKECDSLGQCLASAEGRLGRYEEALSRLYEAYPFNYVFCGSLGEEMESLGVQRLAPDDPE